VQFLLDLRLSESALFSDLAKTNLPLDQLPGVEGMVEAFGVAPRECAGRGLKLLFSPKLNGFLDRHQLMADQPLQLCSGPLQLFWCIEAGNLKLILDRVNRLERWSRSSTWNNVPCSMSGEMCNCTQNIPDDASKRIVFIGVFVFHVTLHISSKPVNFGWF